MIMEAGAEKTNIAQMQVAALSGNTAFNYYELWSRRTWYIYKR